MLTIQKNSLRILIVGTVILLLGLVMFSVGTTGNSDEYTRPEVTSTPVPTPTVAPTLEPTENPTVPPTSSPEPTPEILKGTVNTNSRVRSKPTTEGDAIGSIDADTSVVILRLVNGLDTSNEFNWYEIVYEDVDSGKAYIATQLVDSDNSLVLEEYVE